MNKRLTIRGMWTIIFMSFFSVIEISNMLDEWEWNFPFVFKMIVLASIIVYVLYKMG